MALTLVSVACRPSSLPTTSVSSTSPSTTAVAGTTRPEAPQSTETPPESIWLGDPLGRMLEGTIFTTDIRGGEETRPALYEVAESEARLRAVCCPGPWSGTPFDDLEGGAVYTSEEGVIVRTTDEMEPHLGAPLIDGEGLSLEGTAVVDGRPVAMVVRHEGTRAALVLVDLASGDAEPTFTVELEGERLAGASYGANHFLLTLEGAEESRFLMVDVEGRAVEASLPPPGLVGNGALGPDGRTMAYAVRKGGQGSDLVVWDLATGSELSRHRATLHDREWVEHLDYDGDRLFAERWTSADEESHPSSPLGVDLTSRGVWELDGFWLTDTQWIMFRQVTILRGSA